MFMLQHAYQSQKITLGIGSFLTSIFTWSSGIKLRSPGLHSKHFDCHDVLVSGDRISGSLGWPQMFYLVTTGQL